MADAKKCDRCGTLYDIYSGITFTTNGWKYNNMAVFTNDGVVSKAFELCPNCMSELINFLTLTTVECEERPVRIHTHVHCPKCNAINEYPEFNKTCKYCGAELKEAKDETDK